MDRETIYESFDNGVISLDDVIDISRISAIDEVKELIQNYLIDAMNLENATKYGNKNAEQQNVSYGTLMRYEIADCVDDLLEGIENLKNNK